MIPTSSTVAVIVAKAISAITAFRHCFLFKSGVAIFTTSTGHPRASAVNPSCQAQHVQLFGVHVAATIVSPNKGSSFPPGLLSAFEKGLCPHVGTIEFNYAVHAFCSASRFDLAQASPPSSFISDAPNTLTTAFTTAFVVCEIYAEGFSL